MTTSNTNQEKSRTLVALNATPNTICANCPNALWHVTDRDDLRVFCRLMHVLMDEQLKQCDGNPNP